MRELDTSYDFVAIIDFLPKNERRSSQVGTKLSEFLTKNQIDWNYLQCNSRQEFVKALHWLANKSMDGKVFCLHFIGHGEAAGLLMPPDKTVFHWRMLAPAFARFAKDGLGKTIINLSCCKGINAIKLMDHLPQAESFFGVLGPKIEIKFKTACKLNYRFYKGLLDGVKINDIIRDVNSRFRENAIYGITSHGYRIHKNSK